MKNLAIGFVVGYLVCTFVYGVACAVGGLVEQSFTQVSIWWSQAVDMFNSLNQKVDIIVNWLYNSSIFRRHI